MGLILDSSILIPAERQGKNARQVMTEVGPRIGETAIALSVVTLIELAHGAARADTPERKNRRLQFIQELLTAVPVYSVTPAVAIRAGEIDGESQARGARIPLADLLIGVTALDLGYGVATANPRHFRLIPGLSVVEL